MADMLDYLDWFGDISLAEVPFNEVDNAILSQLAYCALEGVVPSVEEGGAISMAQADVRYRQLHDKESIYGSAGVISPYTALLPGRLGASKRFGNARLSNLYSHLDAESAEQFCAFHIALDDGSTYVTFRGTDDTLVGWREDFEMTYGTVASQRSAVDYLNATCASTSGPLMVGGHSKGGNLAIYGAALCATPIQDRIARVWNNDGPGFDKGVLAAEKLSAIQERISTFIPVFDVVGQLLSVTQDAKIVESDATGIMQHSAMSWQVRGPRFVAASPQELLPAAKSLNQAFDRWLSETTDQERKHVFTAFFDALAAIPVTTLSDLMSGDPAILAAVTEKLVNADPKTRDYIMDLLGVLAGGYMQERVTTVAQMTQDTVAAMIDNPMNRRGAPQMDETEPLSPEELRRYRRYLGREQAWENVAKLLGTRASRLKKGCAVAAGALGAGALISAIVRRRQG
ncbi:hypothetical protein ATOBIA_N15770 [Atopobiaceae bacterium P1]|uniref:DUF2974 family protein n=1 Tax=Leptogranulimonas caecicola TaxID=2894156 RepID=A0AAU9CCG7_9ACTN|nr:Mbeg1-like protein [Leptogranulimonas caecicola]BCV19287.1 hypothetical protein ATOBIA_N15770 [Atopobiaceae bacterium P1]BDC91672.1 hypothetical protein ATTO_15440 [Leptogranulimonas caecicola]